MASSSPTSDTADAITESPAVAVPTTPTTSSTSANDSTLASAEQPASPETAAAKKEKETVDAVDIALPAEDESELAWHKTTLIDEENIKERVTIPKAFAAKYLWASRSSPKESDDKLSFVASVLSNKVEIPPSLLADAHAAIGDALSTKSQVASIPPKPAPVLPSTSTTSADGATPIADSPAPADTSASTNPLPVSDPEPAVEPIITLYSPFDNTPAVLDSIVYGVGTSQGADVLVLDALMLAQGEVGPLGSDLNVFLRSLYAQDDAADSEHRSRQVQRYLRALLDVEPASEKDSVSSSAGEPTETNKDGEEQEPDSSPRPRIVYIRDWGGIASHGQPLLKELILAARARRTASTELLPPSPSSPSSRTSPSIPEPAEPAPKADAEKKPSEPTSDPLESSSATATATATSPATATSTSTSNPTDESPKIEHPTIIVLGVSHSPEASPHNCCSSCTWTRFIEGFESSDPDKLMQLLPDILQPTIDSAQLKSRDDGDMSKVIADAMFTGPKRCGYGGDKTFNDPEVGSGGVYRTIISAYGFHDQRDIDAAAEMDASSKGKDKDKDKNMKKPKAKSKKPDDSIWRKNKATVQKERKEEFGEMRLLRNGNILRKALDGMGGRLPDGVDIFSALPPASKEAEPAPGEEGKKPKKKKTKAKTKEDIELEKFTTIEGLKDNLLSRNSADKIAAIAMHGLPSSSISKLTPPLSTSGDALVEEPATSAKEEKEEKEQTAASGSGVDDDSSTPSSSIPTSASTPLPASTLPTAPPSRSSSTNSKTARPPTSPSTSTSSKKRIVLPESIASAIKASLQGNDQRKKWLDAQQTFKNNGDSGLGLDSDSSSGEETRKEDPIVAKVRASGTLNSYEERLLPGVIDTTQLKTSFDDVCIDPKIIDSVRMIISLPLLYPKAFASGILGAEAMSGILLYGPPGTGKTMLCRAIAKECKVRMLLVTPSSVQDMYVGETEKLVKAIFTLARKIAPCVIFIDELDALFGARSSDSTNGSRYHRSMLTEFMQEMDGLSTAGQNKKKGIVVIGATNRPFDLDDAVLRRLPRRMLLDLPGPKEREQILKVHLRGEELDGIDLTDIARRTNNFSGSDLKNLAVAAALASLKDIIPDMWNARAKAGVKSKSNAADASKTEVATESKDASSSGNDTVEPEKAGDDEEDKGVEEDEEEEEEDEDSDEDDSPEVPSRLLKPAHFKAAFEQVSATCSRDMASVAKLRNWANQFSKDSGAGLGGANGAANGNGHANGGHQYRGLGADGTWDSRYGSTMLQRLTKPPGGNGSGGF